jgi:hypothetical protein
VRATGYNYVAARAIFDPETQARAFNPGDDVPDSAVEGEHAWLVLGEDVEPVAGARLERPANSASHAAWVEFAVGEGAEREAAEGMTRKELIAEFGGERA